MSYPLVPARYDFGKRKGPTLALMIHGAEAEAGVVGYLSRNPARGVSANFVCERSGRMVQMMNLDHASGSVNPNDRSTDKAYFGRQHLVAVLGDWWRDPNSAVISMEGEWYARSGPNAAQVAGLTEWAADMRRRYPSIRGALGHADQTDTKGCPGSTPAVKAIFAAIGGHGLFTGDDMAAVKATPIGVTVAGIFRATANAQTIPIDGSTRGTLGKGAVRHALGQYGLDDLAGRPTYIVTEDGKAAFVAASAGTFTPNAGDDTAGTGDCTAAIAADRANARIVWE